MKPLVFALTIATFCAIALTGCAAEAPAPVASDSPAPSATVSPVQLVAPSPLIDLSCDELVDISSLAPLSTTPIQSFGDSYRVPDAASFGIPQEYSLRQLQGSVCNWNNGLPETDQNGSSNAFTSVTVYLLPDASAAWGHYVELYGDGALTPPACNGTDQVNAQCWWSGLTTDNTWVEITYTGMKNFGSESSNTDHFTGLVEATIETVTAAGHGETWIAPVGAVDLPMGCPGILPATAIASAIGAQPEDIKFSSGPIGGTSLLFEAEAQLQADDCRWFTSSTVSEYGDWYSVLEGGAWAWNDARVNNPQIAAAQPLALPGLAEGDSAWTRQSYGKIVDLIVDGNWISFTIYPDDLTALGVGEEALTSLAQSVVDSVG